MARSPAWNKYDLFPLICVLTACVVTWFFGNVPPHHDELFFIGPALELVRTGHLADPLFRHWAPILEYRFFFQSPIYPVALRWWFQVVGVSSLSLTLLATGVFCFGTSSLYLLLRRLGIQRYIAAIAVITTIAPLAEWSFRPDGLATNLVFVALYLATTRSWPTSLCAYFLFALVCVAEPFSVAWAPAFGIARAASMTEVSITRRRRAVSEGLLLTVAVVGTASLFIASLGGIDYLDTFWADFSYHKEVLAGVDKSSYALWSWITSGYNVTRLPGYIYAVVALGAYVLSRPRLGSARLTAVVMCVAILAISVALYPWKALDRTDLLVLLVAAILCDEQLTRAGRWRLPSAVIFVLAVSVFRLHGWVGGYLMHRLDTDVLARLQTAIHLAHPDKLYIDKYAARYLFDFRIPSGALSWEYEPVKQLTCDAAKTCMWVFSAAEAEKLGLQVSYERLKILGKTMKSLPAYVDDLVLVSLDHGEFQIAQPTNNMGGSHTEAPVSFRQFVDSEGLWPSGQNARLRRASFYGTAST